jgi:hypothetical protein
LDGRDTVELSTVELKDLCFTHSIRRQADNGESCRAEIVWVPSH